jgi:tRNA (cmo5U34)-methyltransferase
LSRSAKEWSSPQNALAYLNVVDSLPHRSEGQSVLIDHLPENTKRVLDLGTGDGRLIRLIKANKPDIEEAVALDVSPTMLKSARDHFDSDSIVKIIEHDLSQPLPDLGYFDAIVSSFAIHQQEYFVIYNM